MPQGSVGFGNAPGDYGPAGMDIPEPIGTAEEQFVDDIHAIKQKYVDGAINLRVPLNFTAAFNGVRQDMVGQKVNSVILTATSGVIFGYLIDVTNQFRINTNQQPDFVADASIADATVQIMVPDNKNYVICFQEGAGATATGSARIMKL